MSPDPNQQRELPRLIAALLIMALGLWVYQNSFTGAFVFDDQYTIVAPATHHHTFWSVWQAMDGPLPGRPVATGSFALNWALGGLQRWGYHAVNLALHLLTALVLCGLIRRTLRSPRLQARYAQAAPWLALTVTLVWTIHPLLTESVTYVTQRAELLLGLWYLLTLYGLCRMATSSHPQGWASLTVSACALGMGSKEVMVSAPIAALLYDRIFLATSFRDLWHRRGRLHLGLMATWLLLLF